MEMAKKFDVTEAKKIWDYFQRFAEYSDLKDLYGKCIPELAKFEQKMINQQNEFQRMEEVIARFDQHLTTKASKMNVSELRDFVDANFVKNDDQKDFISKIDSIINSQADDYKQSRQALQDTRKQLEAKINAELQKLYRKIDGSHLENEAVGPNIQISTNNFDKQEFIDKLAKKSNKTDIEMIFRQIKTMHK